MVDKQSQLRMHSNGYTFPHPNLVNPSPRDLYHQSGRHIFPARKDRPVHDCRADVAKRISDSLEWEAWLLSQGLMCTIQSIGKIQERSIPDSLQGPKNQDKLLYKLGARGREKGNFDYPLGLCTLQDGSIAVADSHNHRVQIFNHFGIFLLSFGERGEGCGQFNEPSDVALMPDAQLAVADRFNKRVQIFSEDGNYVSQISMEQEPYSLASNLRGILAVASIPRTVQVFSNVRPLARFHVPTAQAPQIHPALHVAVSSKEVMVSDAADQLIKVFSLQGALLRQFELQWQEVEGLACMPGALTVTALGQLLVVDTLNHTVLSCTADGLQCRALLQPSEGLGFVRAVKVGPEGHLVLCESSISAEHCLKIFHYRGCVCHRLERLPSSKGRTPVVSPTLEL